jgi:hypothetical protein
MGYMHPAWGTQRHEPGKWFPTEDGVGWGDGGDIELRRGNEVVLAILQVDEQWTGEDEIPSPTAKLADGSETSFFDWDEWRICENRDGAL